MYSEEKNVENKVTQTSKSKLELINKARKGLIGFYGEDKDSGCLLIDFTEDGWDLIIVKACGKSIEKIFPYELNDMKTEKALVKFLKQVNIELKTFLNLSASSFIQQADIGLVKSVIKNLHLKNVLPSGPISTFHPSVRK